MMMADCTCTFSSGAIWEEQKRNRYKALSIKQCQLIEKAYQEFIDNEAANSSNLQARKLDSNLEVVCTETSRCYITFPQIREGTCLL